MSYYSLKKLTVLSSILFIMAGCAGTGGDEPFKFPPASGSGGSAPPPGGGGGNDDPTPRTCVDATDCNVGEDCVGGICVDLSCADNLDCEIGEICADGVCAPVTEQKCADDSECADTTGGDTQICVDENCVTGCRATSDCKTGETCNTSLTVPQCQFEINPDDVCEIRVNSYLELRIDAPRARNDIPSQCPHPVYTNPPHSDLFCCTEDNMSNPDPDPLFGNANSCEHGAGYFGVTQWSGDIPMKLQFSITDDSCEVFLSATDFPAYRLEHSALPASIEISSGADFSLVPSLAAQVARGTCTEVPGEGIHIDGLELQFLMRLFDNFTRCQLGITPNCAEGTAPYPGLEPFSEYWETNISGSGLPIDPDSQNVVERVFQVLPGLDNPGVILTTRSVSMDPQDEEHEGVDTISLDGGALRFVESEGKSRLEFVTAIHVPNDGNPDINAGTGQLQAELGKALLTARIGGIVTNPNNTEDGTIRSLQHIRDNCGNSSGGEGGNSLSLSAKMRFRTGGTSPIQQETLTVEGDVETGFEIDICLPGQHNVDRICVPVDEENLPFAKAAGDPLFPSTDHLFTQEGTFILTIDGGDSNLQIDFPAGTGAFQVGSDDLDDLLEGITILPEPNTELNIPVFFNPRLEGLSTCQESGGIINCTETKIISDIPEIKLVLHGSARKPAPILKLEELELGGNFEPVSTVLPLEDADPTISFAEKIVNVGTDHKLFVITNNGVRALTIDQLRSDDGNKNFRLGSIYTGDSFGNRTWKSDQSSWTILPNSDPGFEAVFFFLNYGPFATQAITTVDEETGQLIRQDFASLTVHGVSEAPAMEFSETIGLSGRAKLDRRATLSIFIQDENKATALGGCNAEQGCTTFETNNFFEPDKGLVFSFRQDGATRALYIQNKGGLEPLRILEPPCIEGPNQDEFTLVVDGVEGDGYCVAEGVEPEEGEETPEGGEEEEPGPEPVEEPAGEGSISYPITLASNESIRIGEVSFAASDAGSFQVLAANLKIVATSGSSDNSPPRLGSNEDMENSSVTTNYAIKGTHAAPRNTKDLVVHRLIAGMNAPLNGGTQQSLIMSTSTRGLLERFATRPLSASEINDYVEIYTLSSTLKLNPETGVAYFNPVITPLDPAGTLRPARDVSGVRLFNGMGSSQNDSYLYEHYVQCDGRPNNDCSFFYLYIADDSIIDESPGCAGDKVAIASAPVADQATGVLTNVLSPRDSFERNCLEEFIRKDDCSGEFCYRSKGFYDPASGELTFPNLAIRLYAPRVPIIDDKQIDSTLKLSFSTECITPNLVNDELALPGRLVDPLTLSDHNFDLDIPENLMDPDNRNLIADVFTGAPCAGSELHGRRRGGIEAAGPNTFDYGTGTPPGAFNFDLAGVSRIRSSFDSASGTMMYIIIKVEIPL